MTGGAWLFFISTGIAGAICCILVMLKAGDSQEKRTKSFIPLCFVVLFWVMVNSAVMVAHHDSLDLLYIRMLRMSVACVVPWLQLWFFLNFTGSPLVNSRPVRWSLITVPSLDILALLTNPLHMLYFTSVEYPRHEEGIFFILHYTGAFCAIAASYAVLLPYILKNFRSYLLVLIAAFGAIAPFAVSVMCILRLFGINYDLTPPAAFLTMATFAYLLYVPRMPPPELCLFCMTRECCKGLSLPMSRC